MPIKVKKVKNNSIISQFNVKKGDKLLSINNNKIRDNLDFTFYASEEELNLKFQRKQRIFDIKIQKEFYEDIGLQFYPMPYRKCVCNCIFCFIDQMHPDSRSSLKIKDDDYRLSFLFGNFITLVNLNKNDYKRIIEQKLSPLYISVHTTDDELRKKMMQYKRDFSIIKKLRFLADNDIMMHTQIVLVPEYNNGKYLKQTVKDLVSFYPYVQTIGIVPVGLTKFRENLPKIHTVKVEQAKKLITQVNKWRKEFFTEYGSGIVQLADEFYLKAGKKIPDTDYYEGFAQIENGIGMVREFLDSSSQYVKMIDLEFEPESISLVTAELIYPVMQEFAAEIQEYYDIPVNVIKVKNKYLGEEVTVSGLLAAEDVIEAINNHESGEIIIIPNNMFNTDQVTLDDKTIEDIRVTTGKEVIIL